MKSSAEFTPLSEYSIYSQFEINCGAMLRINIIVGNKTTTLLDNFVSVQKVERRGPACETDNGFNYSNFPTKGDHAPCSATVFRNLPPEPLSTLHRQHHPLGNGTIQQCLDT